MAGHTFARNLRTRHRVVVAVLAAIVLTGTTVIVLLNRSGTPVAQPIAYTNISRNYKVCFIATTAKTIEAAPSWKAVQDAATHAAINVQRFSPPTGTADELAPYLNSLVALHCQLVVATGADLTTAVVQAANHNPRTHFLIAGDADRGPEPSNIRTIPDPVTDPARVTVYVQKAARGNY